MAKREDKVLASRQGKIPLERALKILEQEKILLSSYKNYDKAPSLPQQIVIEPIKKDLPDINLNSVESSIEIEPPIKSDSGIKKNAALTILFQSLKSVLFLDLPLNILLGAAPATIALKTGAAFSGYLIKNYCDNQVNEIFDKNSIKGSLAQSALCGGAAGTIKSVLTGGLNVGKMMIGSISNILTTFSKYVTKYNLIEEQYSFLANPFFIKGVDTLIKAGLSFSGIPGTTMEKSFLNELRENIKNCIITEFLTANLLTPMDAIYSASTDYLSEQISLFSSELLISHINTITI